MVRETFCAGAIERIHISSVVGWYFRAEGQPSEGRPAIKPEHKPGSQSNSNQRVGETLPKANPRQSDQQAICTKIIASTTTRKKEWSCRPVFQHKNLSSNKRINCDESLHSASGKHPAKPGTAHIP